MLRLKQIQITNNIQKRYTTKEIKFTVENLKPLVGNQENKLEFINYFKIVFCITEIFTVGDKEIKIQLYLKFLGRK